MIYTVRTGEPDYFKCDCQKCGKHIEFPSNGVGVTIDCPHCGKKTVLGVAAGSPMATKSKTALWIALILAVVIAAGALGAFLWIQKQKSKETPVAPAPKPAVAAVTPAQSASKTPASDKPAAPAETIDDFGVSKITLQKVQGSGLVYAVGAAKNTVDRQRFGVRIELNLLDEHDQNIGVVSDYVSVVEPHKDWQFRALLLPTQTGAAKVTVADIKEQQ